MKAINPWINFNGNAEAAFQFYQSVLGGKFTHVVRFRDLVSEDFQMPPEEQDKLMYIGLQFDEGHLLIGNDVPAFMGKVNELENRSKIHFSVNSRQEADQIFKGLSEGAEVEGPMADSPWGTYAGMLRDKFGIEWIVEFQS